MANSPESVDPSSRPPSVRLPRLHRCLLKRPADRVPVLPRQEQLSPVTLKTCFHFAVVVQAQALQPVASVSASALLVVLREVGSKVSLAPELCSLL